MPMIISFHITKKRSTILKSILNSIKTETLHINDEIKIKVSDIQIVGMIAGTANKILPDHLDANAVLSACPDFQFERTALQNIIESRGHILLPSVVCTPETAGGGIEYAWGKLKFEQRRQNRVFSQPKFL
jgi:hypothetical protein